MPCPACTQLGRLPSCLPFAIASRSEHIISPGWRYLDNNSHLNNHSDHHTNRKSTGVARRCLFSLHCRIYSSDQETGRCCLLQGEAALREGRDGVGSDQNKKTVNGIIKKKRKKVVIALDGRNEQVRGQGTHKEGEEEGGK